MGLTSTVNSSRMRRQISTSHALQGLHLPTKFHMPPDPQPLVSPVLVGRGGRQEVGCVGGGGCRRVLAGGVGQLGAASKAPALSVAAYKHATASARCGAVQAHQQLLFEAGCAAFAPRSDQRSDLILRALQGARQEGPPQAPGR